MTAYLKQGREKPFLHRHPWVFSGALQRMEGKPDDGDAVQLRAADGAFVAWGLYNSRSQIRLRLYSWREDAPLDEAFFRARLTDAIRLRDDLFAGADACRLVNSEGDGLSGLTVDRYGRQLVVQVSSLALTRRANMLVALLQNLLKPTAITLRTDDSLLREEGYEPLERVIGRPEPTIISEHGLEYSVDLSGGQKTGFFLDQRDNRLSVRRLASGRRCLDVCCYTGGFAMNMAAGGAREVTAVDVSESALTAATENARRNKLDITFHKADAFVYLNQQVEAGERWDVIVLDPPKFAGGRDTRQAQKGYISLNQLAMRALTPGGYLVTCSCSGRIDRAQFRQVVSTAAHAAVVSLQLLDESGAAADHPVMSSCPESEYLKVLTCRVL